MYSRFVEMLSMKSLNPCWLATVATATLAVSVATNLEDVMAQQSIQVRPQPVTTEALQQTIQVQPQPPKIAQIIQNRPRQFKAEALKQSRPGKKKGADKPPINNAPGCTGDKCKPVPAPVLLPGLMVLGAGFLVSRMLQKKVVN
jgi:hypothetical protein